MLTFAQDYRRPRPAASHLTINRPGDRFEQEAERMAGHATRGGGLDEMAGQAAPSGVQEAVASPGQPLDRETRDSMEARFGHDFGNVRVHTDGKAAESAQQINALAYTSGSDVVFGAGRFQPETDVGQRLLAHELTHVVQQSGGGAAGMVQRQPAGSTDLREDASPSLASALGSTIVDKFALGSDKIPADGESSLKYSASQILFFLRKYPASTVHVVGHTDTVDTKEYNFELGTKRANAVKKFLEDAGVPASIITTDSKGETEPVKPTGNGVAEPLNRRVNVFFRTTKVGISLGLDYTLKPPTMTPPETPKKPDLTVPPGIFDGPKPPYRPPSLWDQMEENQRKIDSYKLPPKKSLGDAIIDGIMDNAVKPLLKKLPISDDLRKKAEGAIRDGLETGTEKGCEAAIDALDLSAEAKEGLKAACKAALKQK